MDLLMLTIVVHYVGSQVTYVGFAYLFHIVLACVFLPRRYSLLVTGMAAMLYVLCITSEILGWAEPSSLFVQQPTPTGSTAIQVGSALGIWVVIWYLVSHLSRIVRERDFTLAQTNQRLEAALVERSQHMLHTTHELKSPFAAIHLNAQLLLEGAYGALSEQATEVVQRIVARCKRLSREIQDMLQLANLQSIGQGATNAVGQIDLQEVLELILYRFNIIAQERQVTLKKDLQSASVIMVDDHLHMLIENLLSNAIFYSRSGGTVSVTCRAGDQGSHVLTIQDEGIGIASKKLPHVFEDYYRAKEAVKHYTESSGLGLAIVRHIAQINRIRVRVESQLGVGTQFVLYFPMNDRTHHSQS
ncbi:MAG: HAMP domain-containing histidine kinase [Phycisphaeraceae bacterium]|nr:HAMP domain-containing histidine kinase [Phycisphaeraceae bacterium]